MNSIVLLAVLVLAFAAVLKFASSQSIQKISKPQSLDIPYCLRDGLFTPAERTFYYALNQAISSEQIVFAKVRVADVIKPASGLSRSQWQSAFNRIQAKHFDFVICDRQTLSVTAAVELQDKSHQKQNRMKRDQFLRKACADARLPLLEFAAKSKYVTIDIENSLTAMCP